MTIMKKLAYLLFIAAVTLNLSGCKATDETKVPSINWYSLILGMNGVKATIWSPTQNGDTAIWMH